MTGTMPSLFGAHMLMKGGSCSYIRCLYIATIYSVVYIAKMNMFELPKSYGFCDRLDMNNFQMQVASTVISTCVMTDIIQQGMYLSQLY